MAANTAVSSGSGVVKGTSRVRTTTREDTAKATVAEHISEAIQSTSNLLQLMQQSSASQALLTKLPKNLIAKASTIKNTGQVLEQMPQVISSLDAHMDNGFESLPHLKTVIQLLTNMESCQLSSLSHTCVPRKVKMTGQREVNTLRQQFDRSKSQNLTNYFYTPSSSFPFPFLFLSLTSLSVISLIQLDPTILLIGIDCWVPHLIFYIIHLIFFYHSKSRRL
ncbi:uncharacterized protein [Euphorbia lathyris]|uniref:uncharacterized protein isoform X2 n=1 Tax=Euphorbia lathyris TaxID=212925 RepID=UPI0033140BD4